MVGVALVAYGQSSVSEQPRDTSFDDPAVLAEFLAGFDAFAGDAHGDSLLAYPVSEFGLVVGFVGVELVRLAPAGPPPGFHGGDGQNQRFEGVRVVGVRGRDRDRQRQSRPVGQCMDLRAGFPAVHRTGTGQRSPLLALTEAPSRTARDQSIIPWLPSSSSTARCNLRHNPAFVHSVKRRCAVGTFTPKLGGRCRQAHPLVSTNTIAVNTARSSTRDRPPPCGRT